MTEKEYRSAIEAILFSAGDPVDIGRLSEALELPESAVKTQLDLLMDEYAQLDRGITVIRLNNTYQMVYKKTLNPGASTKEKDWKTVNFKLPDSPTVHEYVVKITEFEIDHDWIKVIRKNNQPTQKCPVHL